MLFTRCAIILEPFHLILKIVAKKKVFKNKKLVLDFVYFFYTSQNYFTVCPVLSSSIFSSLS